jgi:NADPH-dependent 2,4-dienoyl-CoA reductase/sulfur reductase-like enzyme
MRYVIVGGGITGTTAAEELRKLDEEAEIVLISEEQHPIYSRVLLPHYIKWKVDRDRCFLKKEEWYEEKNIEWLPGTRVEKCDPKNAFVLLSDGRELPYDKLLICTGGEVRMVEEDVRGVSYFRTLDDADHMFRLLEETHAGEHAAIYGGGFIACEYLNIFKQFERPITLLMRGEHFWSRIFAPETGRLLNEHLKKNGVELITNVKSVQPIGGKELTGITYEGGSVECSMLGIGIGIVPEFGWIADAGIDVGIGVKANAFLETNIENIFTAGDIAEFDDVISGRQINVGNWMNAQMQGRAVAKIMTGERTEFKLVSSYATNALELELIFIGDVDKEAADQVMIRGSVEEGGITQFFVRDNKLVGAAVIGRNIDRPPITKLIQSGADVSDRLEDWQDSSNPILL